MRGRGRSEFGRNGFDDDGKIAVHTQMRSGKNDGSRWGIRNSEWDVLSAS